MAKLPFIKFFPRDWLGDDRLRLCSVAARGLWIDMLCLMHSTHRRGYLQTATGSPLPLEQLARMTGCSTDEATRLLSELKDAGVFDCTEHGMIYSRRMAREEHKRERCSAAGTKGGGNPAFKRQRKGDDKGRVKLNPKPSESQILRVSEAQTDPPQSPPGLGVCEIVRPPRFEDVQQAWNGIEGVTPCHHVSPLLRSIFGARCMSVEFCQRWRDGIEAVRRSDRCKGTTGWRADLDWFLKAGSLEKLLNGSFDPVQAIPAPAPTPKSARDLRMEAVFAAHTGEQPE